MHAVRNLDTLTRLVRAALEEADAQGNTLVAAMLVQCLDALERRPPPRR